MKWKHFAQPLALGALAGAAGPAHAQAQTAPAWQQCAEIRGDVARLRCFDEWSRAERTRAAPGTPAGATATAPAVPPAATPQAVEVAKPPPGNHCHDAGESLLARFWELEYVDSDDARKRCGLFGIRSGLRPLSIALTGSDSVNGQPTSANPLNNAPVPQPYRKGELRIQLSVRTKVWQGLAVREGPTRDAVWFGYTQQSYWQVFDGPLSRPFRSTDHEPEVVYVFPLQSGADDRWKMRYVALGAVHQSNGQSLPLSRSWNRAYLMAGWDKGPFSLQAKLWQRWNESPASDDNPGISDFVGRGELTGTWDFGRGRTERLMLTLRSNLRESGRGSQRIEWLHEFDKWQYWGSLRFHTSVFTGYGDSLLDFNRRRTVLGLGVSLVDW